MSALFSGEMDELSERPVDWYREMRKNQPVRYRPEYDLWDVFRYDDVQRVLLDHATFSSEVVRMERQTADTLGNIDPPRHRQLRNIVTQAFTPASVARLAPRITALVDEILDTLAEDGKMDFISQFAYPFPLRVIAALLGVPAEDEQRFWRWSYELIGKLENSHSAENSDLRQYFADMLNERALRPRDDLMSALLTAEAEGKHLTREETIVMCETMLLAGHITTTLLFAQTVRCFDEYPQLYPYVRRNPAVIPKAIEEVLRYGFLYMRVPRLARCDCTLGGHTIKKGQQVMAWMGSANFDEQYFPNAEVFDARRTPNPHLTFSYGIHYCLGAPLARLEGKIALERITERFANVRTDPDDPIQYMGKSFGVIVRLPVIFTEA